MLAASTGVAFAAPVSTPHGGSFLDQIKNRPRVLLLGEAGAGKTTLLEYIAWQQADNLLRSPAIASPFPIYLALKYCAPARGKSVAELISSAVGLGPEIVGRLLGKNLVLLLDGLNEIPEEQQDLVVHEIQELLTTHPRVRAIITCRPMATQALLDCPRFELQALTDEQIENFLQRHFPEPALATTFAKAVRVQPKLWEWGRNPLCLAMLTKIGLEQGGSLPENLGKLIQRFLRGILEREGLQSRVTLGRL